MMLTAQWDRKPATVTIRCDFIVVYRVLWRCGLVKGGLQAVKGGVVKERIGIQVA